MFITADFLFIPAPVFKNLHLLNSEPPQGVIETFHHYVSPNPLLLSMIAMVAVFRAMRASGQVSEVLRLWLCAG